MDKIGYALAVIGFLFLCKLAHDAYVKYVPDPVKPYWDAYHYALVNYLSNNRIKEMHDRRRLLLKQEYKIHKSRGYSPSTFQPDSWFSEKINGNPLSINGAARAYAACQTLADIDSTLRSSLLLSPLDPEYAFLESIKKEQIKYLAPIIDDSSDPLNHLLFYSPSDLARYPDVCPESLRK